MNIQCHISFVASCILYFFSCYTPYKFGTWILGFELQVPIRVLGINASPRLVSTGCLYNAADLDLNCGEIVTISKNDL